jgi:hypothetical protein
LRAQRVAREVAILRHDEQAVHATASRRCAAGSRRRWSGDRAMHDGPEPLERPEEAGLADAVRATDDGVLPCVAACDWMACKTGRQRSGRG